MRVVIAGTRTITNPKHLEIAIANSGFEITEVVSGCARGVDALGEQWAHKMGIPIKHYPANWKQFGKRAGFLRNEDMALYAEALIAIWDGESHGTSHMIAAAKSHGCRVHAYIPRPPRSKVPTDSR